MTYVLTVACGLTVFLVLHLYMVGAHLTYRVLRPKFEYSEAAAIVSSAWPLVLLALGLWQVLWSFPRTVSSWIHALWFRPEEKDETHRTGAYR